MAAEFTVLTVCTGNLHRSPLAAALLARWAEWYLDPSLASRVVVRSAGIHAARGSDMDARVVAMASGLGADTSGHRPRQLTEADLADVGLVLTATERHRDAVLERAPGALRKTFTMREAGRIAEKTVEKITASRPAAPADLVAAVSQFANSRTPAPRGADDIVDPQGRGDDVFLDMVGEEVPPLAWVAFALFGMPRPDLDAYLASAGDRSWLASHLSGAAPR